MSHTFVLNKRTIRVLWKLKHEKLVCVKCGVQLEVGDKVVSQKSSNHPRYFHAECWELMFIEV